METIEHALLIDPDNDNMRYNFACAAHGLSIRIRTGAQSTGGSVGANAPR